MTMRAHKFFQIRPSSIDPKFIIFSFDLTLGLGSSKSKIMIHLEGMRSPHKGSSPSSSERATASFQKRG